MDYILLETFLIVCESLNLSTAAKIMYCSQPTITNRLKMLEEYLGFQLIIRRKGKRSVEITGQGEQFLSIAKRLLDLYKQIDVVKKNLPKNLNISSIDSIGTTILPKVIMSMEKTYGKLYITIHTHQTEECYSTVDNREADMAFVSREIKMQNIICEPIFSQDYYVCHTIKELKNAKEVHPKDLKPEWEIFQNWGYDYMQWHNYWWLTETNPYIKVDSITLVNNFINEEDKWTIVQASSVKLLKSMHNLYVLKLIQPPPSRVCYLITNRYPNKLKASIISLFRKSLYKFINDNSDILHPLWTGYK